MHEYDFGFSLPKGYQVFLDDLGDQPGYDIGETGICLYAKEDLTERNQTYQIDEDEPDFFMIGQDGDLAYFLKKNGDDSIYENDLGALGSLEMQKVAESIADFINQILQEE
ncbi:MULTISPECIES: hypothetical protein [Streptococcus]|jgi:hypothetical protein|uniref:SMI1/KNR4 family protein n=2 Tax=Streptococcus TaxID=1301 RepID=A0A4Z1DX91_9STRE|nr:MULTISPECIES: hypothetical protein [Streptococcus]EFV98638.1 hypothetical protein HMPREF9421_1850 [Streptococcus australis ATCC 700641]EGU66094.1 hypothetical protein HMPREF9961_0778 [Streptococcus australis ATCC 700641]MBK4774985.1 hypothetical protein [Streptococcus rubneri]RSK05738.1 hypothetical protein D8782_03150 [Streptococcus sp. A12]TGN91494.1 hypothetical protein E5S68_00575 [Streptococcus rubneri]